MAMQTGIGLSKILIIFGAGYTGTVLFKNGKLSDIIGELQSLVKGLEKSNESSDGDATDAIAQQVRRLAMEVRQIVSAPQIAVLNGNSGRIGNLSNLIVPATALGALGYGYMWWKGISFSDLMYVTKKSMATAVSNLTKHLEHVSDALAATKRHLTQRIENLDGKLDDQMKMSKLIKNEVGDVRSDLSQISYDLDALQRTVSGLDGKIMSLEDKQDVSNMGVAYLINFAAGRKTKVPDQLQEKLLLAGKSQGYLTCSETPSLKGLKEIADTLVSGNFDRTNSEDVVPGNVDKLDNTPRTLLRAPSTKG